MREQKNVQNSAQFHTTLEFDCIYLWKQMQSTSISSALEKKLLNLGLLATKFHWPMRTHPKSSVRAILDNSRVWSQISAEQIKISTTGNKLDRHLSLLHWAKKNLVNFGPLTPEIMQLTLTHLKSTMRVLRMPMQLSSGHVTLLRGEFQPP